MPTLDDYRASRAASLSLLFGAGVRAQRVLRGMSQAELGQRFGISRAGMGVLETGARGVSVLDIAYACELFDVSAVDLLMTPLDVPDDARRDVWLLLTAMRPSLAADEPRYFPRRRIGSPDDV